MLSPVFLRSVGSAVLRSGPSPARVTIGRDVVLACISPPASEVSMFKWLPPSVLSACLYTPFYPRALECVLCLLGYPRGLALVSVRGRLSATVPSFGPRPSRSTRARPELDRFS